MINRLVHADIAMSLQADEGIFNDKYCRYYNAMTRGVDCYRWWII